MRWSAGQGMSYHFISSGVTISAGWVFILVYREELLDCTLRQFFFSFPFFLYIYFFKRVLANCNSATLSPREDVQTARRDYSVRLDRLFPTTGVLHSYGAATICWQLVFLNMNSESNRHWCFHTTNPLWNVIFCRISSAAEPLVLFN